MRGGGQGRFLYDQNPEEVWANSFAMALLMPAHMVLAAEMLHLTTEEMALRFGVDVEVMALRRRDVAERSTGGGTK